MTKRLERARADLDRAGFLQRQPDGYWATEPYQPERSYGERTILQLIMERRARVTAHDTYRRKPRMSRIEKE